MKLPHAHKAWGSFVTDAEKEYFWRTVNKCHFVSEHFVVSMLVLFRMSCMDRQVFTLLQRTISTHPCFQYKVALIRATLLGSIIKEYNTIHYCFELPTCLSAYPASKVPCCTLLVLAYRFELGLEKLINWSLILTKIYVQIGQKLDYNCHNDIHSVGVFHPVSLTN